MTVTYKLLLDKRFYRTAVSRFYKQRPLWRKFSVRFSLLLILFIGVLAYAWKTNAEWLTIAGWGFAFWMILSVSGFFFTKWSMVQRFKRRTDFNTEATVLLSDEGISVRGRRAKSELEWAAYPGAARCSDGILLVRKGVIRWLPDASIQDGTPKDAENLVKSNSNLRYL